MPTQTRFIAPSGGTNLDLSGIFADLDGGTSYGTATKFIVGSLDLTGYFHASTGTDDRPNFNTGYKITVGGVATDLSVIFRRRGFAGLNITTQPESQTKTEGQTCTFTIAATTISGTLTYQWKKWNGTAYADINGATTTSYTTPTLGIADDGSKYICTVSNGTSTVDSQEAIITVHYVDITVSPASNSYNAGDSPTLSVTATSNPTPPLYLWQYSSNNNDPWSDKAGQTNSTLTLLSLIGNINNQDGGQGYYRCRVRNNNSSITEFSQSAYIQVYYAAVITTQPQSINIVVNGTTDAVFSIVANGKTTPTYQWQEFNGSWANIAQGANRITGQTSSSLTVQDVASTDSGRTFRCQITNNNATGSSFGTTTSNQVTLSVVTINGITPSGSVTRYYGTNVVNNDFLTITVSVSGSGPLSYQWYKLAGITPVSLGTANGAQTVTFSKQIVSTDNGTYNCFVYNSFGGNYSPSLAVTTVDATPVITTQPVSQGANPNEYKTFTVVATKPAAVAIGYQWKKLINSVYTDIVGATSASYQVGPLTTANDSDVYLCNVYTNYGGVNSNAVKTTIRPNVSVGITNFTAPFTFGYNTVITITASSSQGQNISYVWYGPDGIITNNQNGYTIISGTQLRFNLTTANDGNYYAVGTNDGGSSQATAITINMQQRITSQPQSTTVNAGGNAVFSVTAEGSGTLTYTWYRNGALIVGAANSPSFAEIGVTSGYNGYTYQCIITSNAAGTIQVASSLATLTVNYAPSNMTLSGQEIYNLGDGASFTANITLGNPTSTTYTWYRSTDGGANYFQVAQTAGSTSTSNTYSAGTVTNAMSGYKYYCVASNTAGSVEVAQASRKNLYVNPNIITNPTDQTVAEGDNAIFTVSAGGSSLSYTWYRSTDGGSSYSTFGAANNPTYAAINVSINDDGFKFYCVVSSSISGTTQATSSIVTLNVV